MFCPGPDPEMVVEQAVQLALAETRSYSFSGAKLQFLGADGSVLACLVPAPASEAEEREDGEPVP